MLSPSEHRARNALALTLKAQAPRPPTNIVNMAPFALMHLAAAMGAWWVGVTWFDVLLCALVYYVRMFGITAGYHRYFAHRAYKTSRGFQFLLAVLAQSSAQKGVLWWSGHHRNHHRYADTPRDLHSPTRHGFWWSHVGWILDAEQDEVPHNRINDFARFPELRWLNQHHLVPPTVLAVVMLALFGWHGLVWGFLVSTVVLFHGTFTINSLSHVFGTRRYATPDTSRNNGLLALITLGEGWHNNHHHYCSSANQGFVWWEIDPTYYALRALEAVGVVWDLRTPPERVLREGRRPKPTPPTPAVAVVPGVEPAAPL